MSTADKKFEAKARTFAEDRRDWIRTIISDGSIPANYRLVATAIGLRMNHATEDSFPSLKTIAMDSSTSLRTAIRATQFLEEKGYLKVARKRRGGNRYEMVLLWK